MSFVQMTVPLVGFAPLGALLLNSLKDHQPKYLYAYLKHMPTAVALSVGSLVSLITYAFLGDLFAAVFGLIAAIGTYSIVSRFLWHKEGMFATDQVFVPAEWSNVTPYENDSTQQDPPNPPENA